MHHKDFDETLQKKLSKTVVHRVFYIFLLFLVLPLLIHTWILYRYQYNNQMNQIYRSLKIITQDEAIFFQRTLDKQYRIMEVESNKILKTSQVFTHENLQDIRLLTQAQNFIYITKKNDEFWITQSTMEGYFGKLESSNFLTLALQDKQNFIADPERSFFYLTYKVSSDSNDYLVGVFSFKDYIFRIKRKIDFPYDLDISLLSDDLKVLESTENNFLTNKEEIQLKKVASMPQGYIMEFQKEKHLAAIVKVPQTNYFFLVNISEEDVISEMKKSFYTHLILFFTIALIVGGGLVFFVLQFLSKPIEHLLKTIQAIRDGRFHEKYQKQRFGFEANLIGEACNQMVEDILKKTEEIEKQKLARSLLAQEMHLAHLVQKELMPRKEDLKSSFLEMAALYLPAKEVGGDFYDYFPLDKDRVLIVIADTSGKGISACLYSLIVRSLLRAFAEKSNQIEEILANTNNLLYYDTHKSSFFVTAWIGLIDRKMKKMVYSSAGHFPAILKRKDALIELNVNNLALGIQPQEKFITQEIPLELGDVLFLYSDGVIEMENQNKEFWGKEKMHNFLLYTPLDHPEKALDHLAKELQEFSLNTIQHDDTTAFMIKNLLFDSKD